MFFFINIDSLIFIILINKYTNLLQNILCIIMVPGKINLLDMDYCKCIPESTT